VVEELALELRELLVGVVADAEEDLLKLLQVLDRGRHRGGCGCRAPAAVRRAGARRSGGARAPAIRCRRARPLLLALRDAVSHACSNPFEIPSFVD